MKYWTILLMFFVIGSCREATDKAYVDKNLVVQNQLLTGKILLNDTIIDEFNINNCFCNLTDKGLRINHKLSTGFVGRSLILDVIRDTLTIYSQFSAWSDVGHIPSFSITDSEIMLNKREFHLADTVQGKIKVEGVSTNYGLEGISVKFSIGGTFKCILKDTSYTYDSFVGELRQKYYSEEWERLKQLVSKNPDSVIELNLNSRGLRSIPEEISIFSKLKSLNLNGNEISEIDIKIIVGLKDLVELDLSNNQIHELPSSISHLKQLQVLDLSGNPIRTLPLTIFQFQALEELNLAETEIANLSSEIKNLRRLKNLNIAYTRLKRIPPQVFALDELVELNLPDSIELFKISNLNLQSLRVLSASYDFLAYNKSDIHRLSQLEWLYPRYFYSSHEDYKKEHGSRVKWLEKELPTVSISSIIIETNN